VRAGRRGLRRRSRGEDPRDDSAQPLQARHAAHRQAQPAHRRPRLPLSARLGSGLRGDEAGAGPTAGPRVESVSVGPAPLRLSLGYGLAIAAATSFGIGGIIAKSAFNAGVAPSILAEWR